MYLCIYPSIHLSIYPSIHPSIYLSIYLSVYIYTHTYIYTYIYIYTYVYIYTHTYIYIYTYVYIYIYIYTYVYIYIYTYIYIYIYIYIKTPIYLSIYLSIYLLHRYGYVYSCFCRLPSGAWGESRGLIWGLFQVRNVTEMGENFIIIEANYRHSLVIDGFIVVFIIMWFPKDGLNIITPIYKGKIGFLHGWSYPNDRFIGFLAHEGRIPSWILVNLPRDLLVADPQPLLGIFFWPWASLRKTKNDRPAGDVQNYGMARLPALD